jgi:hypothetical protein
MRAYALLETALAGKQAVHESGKTFDEMKAERVKP